jgi:serine protease
MSASSRTTLIAAVSAVAVLAVAATVAQQAPEPFGRWLADYPLPAIDRGIRDQDPPRPPRTGGSTYLPGSIVVKFRDGTPMTARRAVANLVDGEMTQVMSNANFDVLRLDAGVDAERVAARLSAQPDVDYAQARYLARPHYVPNDPFYSRQWNFPAIDMERAWDINPGATSSITVAVLDSGVAYANGILQYNAVSWRFGPVTFPALGRVTVPFAAAPDLADSGRFVAPRDFIWGDQMPFDLEGHGTHVAGTIGQLTNNNVGVAGMAFNVRIMPVKVLDGPWDEAFGSPFVGTDDTVARGIRYAVDNGAKVLNMSIGRNGAPAPVVEDAVRYAVSRGAFVVVSGGNDFLEGSPPERYAEFAPRIDGMVAVAAVGRDKLHAGYSSVGAQIELAAPGGDFSRGGTMAGILQQTYDPALVETYLGSPSQYRAPRFDAFVYLYASGTSMAAPHVSGFAAMLMQQGITSPAAIEAVMKQFATDLGAAGRDDEYGYGLINPRAALRGLGLAK